MNAQLLDKNFRMVPAVISSSCGLDPNVNDSTAIAIALPVVAHDSSLTLDA
jgi:hypothetical protein